jgi:FMN-dependent NADH-azoreductase
MVASSAALRYLLVDICAPAGRCDDRGAEGVPDEGGSDMLDEFLAADILVIGAPTYNFGIPGQLKAWIDRIAIAGKTFSYTADGPIGLAQQQACNRGLIAR